MTPMLVGYAQVSTVEQTLALQQDALTAAGCEWLLTDTASGSLAATPTDSPAGPPPPAALPEPAAPPSTYLQLP